MRGTFDSRCENLRRAGILAAIAVIATLAGSGCVRKVTIPELLPVEGALTTEQLVSRVESLGRIDSFAAQGTIYVRNYFTGRQTKAEDFPGGNQIIRLRRPASIRLRVTAPVVGSQVADMVSDGRMFRLAVYYPTNKRRFVRGSNLREIERMAEEELEGSRDPDILRAGGLLNMRPQHITDAFLIHPTMASTLIEIFREEFRQEEADPRSGKKGRRVEKTYYIVFILERENAGPFVLRRKFWFDRTAPGTPLARQQTFDNSSGRLASDIAYSDWTYVADAGLSLPRRVSVDRRFDGYRVELVLDTGSIQVNEALPDTAFILENTEGLQEVDLDKPRKASTAIPPKPKPSPPLP